MTRGWFNAEECGSWPLPLLPDAILKSFYTRFTALESRFYTQVSPFLAFLCSSLPVEEVENHVMMSIRSVIRRECNWREKRLEVTARQPNTSISTVLQTGPFSLLRE